MISQIFEQYTTIKLYYVCIIIFLLCSQECVNQISLKKYSVSNLLIEV